MQNKISTKINDFSQLSPEVYYWNERVTKKISFCPKQGMEPLLNFNLGNPLDEREKNTFAVDSSFALNGIFVCPLPLLFPENFLFSARQN